MQNRSMCWPRGRVLSGFRSINGLVFISGQAADYDAWEKFGNLGWGCQDVLPDSIKF